MVVEKLCCLTLLHLLSFLLILVVAILIVLQSKVASRRSYTEWIKESTKNSGELDADIERILRGTRELQLESNSIQERLQTLSGDGLLTSIHESFEQISEKILATDRIRTEMADHEKKLAGMAS
ncbi:hypothetical protein SCA6_018846 [Theobroma cacao]